MTVSISFTGKFQALSAKLDISPAWDQKAKKNVLRSKGKLPPFTNITLRKFSLDSCSPARRASCRFRNVPSTGAAELFTDSGYSLNKE